MRLLGKFLGRLLITVIALGAALYAFGPREPVDLTAPRITLGADLDQWLADREAVFDDIVPGTEKRIIWAGEPGERSQVSVVYLHGFSASSEEIRPLPDQVAAALSANLYFPRLAGHGRTGAALAGPVVNDWIVDLAEAMEIGRAIGDEVIVIATSTGGTLAALGALDDEVSARLKGIVFLSPNFRIKDPAARLLTLPLARDYLPRLAGEIRSFTPKNAGHAQFWTESYPTVALLPMAAMVKAAREAEYGGVATPALFVYSPDDQVIDGAEVARVAARWGGPVRVETVAPQEGMDPDNHVIAGEIMSPAMTVPLGRLIVEWAWKL
ncbi:alpha/beta hydrolase [Aliiroseovarius sp.]|uniref:alpha/beta hydrolase n=1 Tax=Aliiroseovarius sp. TaxID=1872442 RepID=UPI003BACB46F